MTAREVDTHMTAEQTVLPDELPFDLVDGYEVHRAALARGLDVVLLPRQVMLVGKGEGTVGQTSFTHGIPQSMTLSGATFAQDKRMRRDMMTRAGYKVAKGATFSVGRSRKSAAAYAEKIGYPVVIKPAIGDNTVETISGINNAEELNEAIDHFVTPPADRPGFTRAAYGLTELREPGIQDGKPVVPPGYRFIVEKQVPGEYVRVLTLNGEVLNVLYLPDGPWDSGDRARDITDEVHSSITDVALGAAAAVTGVPLAVVDLVVKDHTQKTTINGAPIVDFSGRPWLKVQGGADDGLPSAIAGAILGGSLPELQGAQPAETVQVRATIEGVVDTEAMVRELGTWGDRNQVSISAEVLDSAMGQVVATINSDPARTATLVEKLLGDGVTEQRAMMCHVHHIQDTD